MPGVEIRSSFAKDSYTHIHIHIHIHTHARTLQRYPPAGPIGDLLVLRTPPFGFGPFGFIIERSISRAKI